MNLFKMNEAKPKSPLSPIQRRFDRATLSGVNFRGADLSRASFVDADLRDVDFSGAKLTRAQLERCRGVTDVQLVGAIVDGKALNGRAAAELNAQLQGNQHTLA